MIELRPRARGVRGNRLRQYVYGLECPPLAPLRKLAFIDHAAPGCRAGRSVGSRVRRATGDPRLEIGDHLVRKLAARRHLQMGIRVLHRMNQLAVSRLARNQCRPERATLHDAFAAVEGQVALRFFHLAVVAGVALGCEDGPDFRFKELVGNLRARRRAGQDNQKGADKDVPGHGHETSEGKVL